MKDLWKTKTFWGGLASTLTGVGLILTGDVPQGMNLILTGIMSVFIRDGIRKITPVAK